MQWSNPIEDIHTWWEGLPGERFWLDVTHRNDRHKALAAPRGDARSSRTWIHQLIRHVKRGDIVFHYDAMQQAIVAWSVSHGRVEKRHLPWPLPAADPCDEVTCRSLPSWAIDLRQPTRMDPVLPLRDIARTQWDLFPALRALEDHVGDPLYYPFDTGNREATRLLPGFVFKLPAVLVQGIPELALVAGRVSAPITGGAIPAGIDGLGASPPQAPTIARITLRDVHDWHLPGRHPDVLPASG